MLSYDPLYNEKKVFAMVKMDLLLDFDDIQQQRKHVRRQRRQLNKYQLSKAEHLTSIRLLNHPKVKFKQHIGIYLDAFGEVPTKKLMMMLFRQKKSVYLPLICPMNQHLRWQKISLTQWRNQRFALHPLGMQQAMHHRGCLVTDLDTVILPLVLFDTKGHRVGMGGGFYDRTLACAPHQPYRIGLAHDFQKTTRIMQTQSWDQSLHSIITPSQTLFF